MTHNEKVRFQLRRLGNGDAVFEVANGAGESSWYLRPGDIDRLLEAIGYDI